MSKVFTITEGLENMGALRTGGQGSVYKGRRTGTILCAVKVLPTPIYAEDENDKNYRSFLNEVNKLKKVNEQPNPNVVKILNSGLTESGSLPFIEMEFIEGDDLEELLKPPHDRIFTIKETIKLADHLANALAHCHKFGVKHGDVKSNNVKYNIHSGNYVLLDFGLAIMSDEQRRTSIRHAGAIEFMAPEQNTGEMLFQTDIYSYGIILYELIAGQVPFPLQDSGETSRNAVMLAHMETPVPDMLELRRKNLPADWAEDRKDHEMGIPQWLIQLVSKCLEKAPENRYADGVTLQEALIFGSTDTITSVSDSGYLNALKLENEQLTAQLSTLQEVKVSDKKAIRIPKTPLLAACFILIMFTVLGSYRVLKRYPNALHALRTALFSAKEQPVASVPIKPVPEKKPVVVVSHPDTNRSVYPPAKTQVEKDSALNAANKKAALHKKKKKPKKKKFLGIF